MIKKILRLRNLGGKSFAVDASNELYQFLALIRMSDGTPLQDSNGNVTSHLAGLAFRSTRLISDFNMRLVFVFDGAPPDLKHREIVKRRRLREKAAREWEVALKMGDKTRAFAKAVMASRLTRSMTEDAKRLLKLLGIPFVQAPSEAEAQAAFMASEGDVWAASSRDYDSLLFGAPRLVRYLTISGKEFLPSKGIARPLKPELIDLSGFLAHHEVTREQLIDIAILIGTDFNKGAHGIGPKTAVNLLKKYGKIENMPNSVKAKIEGQDFEQIREIFLHPAVTSNYTLDYQNLNEEKLTDFLCDQRNFSPQRVETVIRRMKQFFTSLNQTDLEQWFAKDN